MMLLYLYIKVNEALGIISFRTTILISCILLCGHVNAQCTSGLTSVTSTGSSQRINGINIFLSSPTNAQTTRVTLGSISGYYIGDDNSTEEILFTLNKPITQIRITARALSAVLKYDKIEYFTLEINGVHHIIQPSELITPDPNYGREGFLQANGTILGDTIPDGDGSFIFTYNTPANSPGIRTFKIKDSIANLTPEGAIFDVQIYSECRADTSAGTGTITNKFFTPSAFTPNQDGKNDFFKPFISGNIKHFELFIYNRWGQVVFHTRDATKGWDGKYLGKEQDNNIFIWQCAYQFEGEPVRRKKGTVVLIK